MTPDQLLTKKDLEDFKKELFELLAPLKGSQTALTTQQWLKNKDVRQLLKISNGTLQNLRDNGTLPFKKLGGLYYYSKEDIEKMLTNPEKKSPKKKT
jgi:hypothetical protein